jgi:hypothetical protein
MNWSSGAVVLKKLLLGRHKRYQTLTGSPDFRAAGLNCLSELLEDVPSGLIKCMTLWSDGCDNSEYKGVAIDHIEL